MLTCDPLPWVSLDGEWEERVVDYNKVVCKEGATGPIPQVAFSTS
jgi:hypothetical protein